VKRQPAWDLISCKNRQLKGAAIQRGLEPGSRRIATVRSRYQATTSEDTAGWERLSVCASDLLNVWKSALAL
jgi:hypothetical protein